ncbi:MAG: ATP-binding protein [Deltaproteobacteria bacterium]|uniref:AAA family ATPase n=1 Tax=Desulfobacula sp. TaxID=2593537 RepID=UPI0019871A4B|nr:ATP-binding protein [Candidatus Desulfobacula maris]MBL6994797.1 AAA family ATPase [Desulfobacula sp.]
MIIEIEIENWKSFRDPTLFTMLASRERQHSERLARINKYKMRILPITAIYGGNASGKSVFFEAINFVKNFVTNGVKPEEQIPVEPYRLDPKFKGLPTKFRFEILVDGIVYDYSFAVTNEKVIKEKLVKITSSSEKILFHRQKDKLLNLETTANNEDYLNYAFHGTHDNQLFLSNTVFQKITLFKPVFDWFKKSLVLISPMGMSDPVTALISKDTPLYETIKNSLYRFDTGIMHLEGEIIPFDSIPMDDKLKDELKKTVTESTHVELVGAHRAERIVLSKKEGEMIAKKLVSYHQSSDGQKVKFELTDESDGTRRLIELLPGFYNMSNENNAKVYIIDEIDRSLHSLLTRQLLNLFLCSYSEKSRSQLLFTTHDLLLMDQTLLRRDEMWIAERNDQGSSTLISFAEFKDVRSDKDIRKSYLQGRLGGIPNVLINECFTPFKSEYDG